MQQVQSYSASVFNSHYLQEFPHTCTFCKQNKRLMAPSRWLHKLINFERQCVSHNKMEGWGRKEYSLQWSWINSEETGRWVCTILSWVLSQTAKECLLTTTKSSFTNNTTLTTKKPPWELKDFHEKRPKASQQPIDDNGNLTVTHQQQRNPGLEYSSYLRDNNSTSVAKTLSTNSDLGALGQRWHLQPFRT